ncbi:hypothetical protein BKA61DRAFT_573231 [Leptodontidium sp. MPI-SDFR-AT-0119]|nr:hypothetical protein BKA61DRAFT_573231 [Leptodontidium sp. MPI-SDFR-AT-0119]
MSFLTRLRTTRISQHPLMHSTLSTALCCKTAAFIGAGVYQVFYIAGVGVGVGVRDGIWDGNVSRNRRRRYTTEFLGDRVEELWGLVGRGKDGVWIEARRDVKAKWRAEREKDRKVRWERKQEQEERERVAGEVKEPSKGKGTILRVTFPWDGKRR